MTPNKGFLTFKFFRSCKLPADFEVLINLKAHIQIEVRHELLHKTQDYKLYYEVQGERLALVVNELTQSEATSSTLTDMHPLSGVAECNN